MLILPPRRQATQTYPRGYGLVVGKSYKQWRDMMAQGSSALQELGELADSSDSDYSDFNPGWPDAQLKPVFQHVLKQSQAVKQIRQAVRSH